jgi:hypothetical protein
MGMSLQIEYRSQLVAQASFRIRKEMDLSLETGVTSNVRRMEMSARALFGSQVAMYAGSRA